MVRRGLLHQSQCSYFTVICFCFLCLLNRQFLVFGVGPDCIQDDHGPADMIQNGVMNEKYKWFRRGKKTYVPVVMDHSYSHREHGIIVGGLKEISQKTCIEFDVYDNEHEVREKDFVYINRNTKRGCYSYIGRIGGKQEIGLPKGCISHRTSMHEMLHALGFRHEHVRHDRDEYVTIMWENIRRGRENNFKKRGPSNRVNGPYDYDSIMHYERKAFSKNKKDTIQPLKSGVKIGVKQKMSHWDAKKVNIVYRCGSGYYSSSDIEAVLEHSPGLSGFSDDDEESEKNETLPIAEFDDYNKEPSEQREYTLYEDDDDNNHLNNHEGDDHDGFPTSTSGGGHQQNHQNHQRQPPHPPHGHQDDPETSEEDQEDEGNNDNGNEVDSSGPDSLADHDHYGNHNNRNGPRPQQRQPQNLRGQGGNQAEHYPYPEAGYHNHNNNDHHHDEHQGRSNRRNSHPHSHPHSHGDFLTESDNHNRNNGPTPRNDHNDNDNDNEPVGHFYENDNFYDF